MIQSWSSSNRFVTVLVGWSSSTRKTRVGENVTETAPRLSGLGECAVGSDRHIRKEPVIAGIELELGEGQ